MWVPVLRSWRLNERHCGALQGRNKAATPDQPRGSGRPGHGHDHRRVRQHLGVRAERGRAWRRTLTADNNVFAARLGDVVNYQLNAGPAGANRIYLMAGTLSGTAPGFPLGSALVPLNPDPFTSLLLGAVNTPALVGWLGVTRHSHAFGLRVFPLNFASNPVALEMMPW